MIRTTVLALALALAAPSALAASCTCGYQLKSYGNAYFRHLLSADFTTTSLSGTATGPNWLGQYGLYIADGYQSGAQSEQPDGTTPIAHYTNVRVQNGALQLVVPGGQKITSGGQTSVAEVDGPSGIINGVMTMNAKIDPTAGTCQSIVSTALGFLCGRRAQPTSSSRTTMATTTRTSRISKSSARTSTRPARTARPRVSSSPCVHARSSSLMR
jgi:hypothetical protein